ncbi:MAG TPA: radical SAM protein [Acidiferrobacteraceae bacterium]|nr:radical SAM protein [Acidiferrobacteraceae bacterium]
MGSFINRLNIARDFLGGRERSAGAPLELSIELTSECNLVCCMCPRDDNAKRGLGYMTFDTFRRIIDETATGLEFAYLHLAGEPLLHPEFERFIDYAAEQGVHTGISTNGTILSKRRAKRLLASSLDTLIISIDGTDAETYKRIRGANSFNKVVRNTEGFLDLKEEAGKGPFVVIQMICMEENHRQAKDFCRRWKRAGVNAVRLKRFFNFAGQVADMSPEINDKMAVNNKPPKPCMLPWRQLAFYYDGTAVACCHDFLHETELGNIHQHSLEEIWNSTAMREVRRCHVEGRKDDIDLCAGCNQPEISLIQLMGLTLMNGRLAKRSLITAERIANRLGLGPLY